MIERLSQRDRIFLAVGGTLAACALLVGGVILPWRAAMNRLDHRIVARQEQIVESRELVGRIAAMQTELAITDRRLQAGPAGALSTHLETIAGRVVSRENLLALRPLPTTPASGFRRETVEARFEKIRLDQLVRLLHAIERADACLQTDGVKVRARFEDSTLLDATLTVSSFARAR